MMRRSPMPKKRATPRRKGAKAPQAPGHKGKAQAAPASPGSLMDQLKDLWGRLTGKG